MTSTSVVLGIATLGTPPDCDCATDAAGSAAMSKGIMDFIRFTSRLFCIWRLSLACLIFARRAPLVTRLRWIDFRHEIGHKVASRSKELNSERRRSGTSRLDDPLSGRITGRISGDLRAARA